MAVSHTLIVAAVLSSLLVCGRADFCVPDCRGGSDFFPHPQDCSSFYQCDYGIAYHKRCPAGLEFSSTGLICDYPAQARCTSDPARDCGVAAPSQELSPTQTCAPKCPSANAYMPHPQNPSKFYICQDMLPYEMNCQPGLVFDLKYFKCSNPIWAYYYANPDIACDEYIPRLERNPAIGKK